MNLRKKVLKTLLESKHEDVAVFEILEAYITERIMGGDAFRSKDLAGIQQKIEETNKFLEFLKRL